MKHAHYNDTTGEIIGYYDDTLHNAIPTPNVELADEVWLDCINHNGLRRIDLGTGKVVVYTPPPPPLADVIATACAAIDTRAGEVRASYVSPGTLVEQEYALAEREAGDWIAAGKPADAVPPSVQSWADVSGITPSAAAANIIDTAAVMYNALRDIRTARLTGKAAVANATDHAAVVSAQAAALVALDALRLP